MKILITGNLRYTMISPFYRLLKKNMPESTISIYGIREPGTKMLDSQFDEFDEVIKDPEISRIDIRKKIIRLKWIKLLDIKDGRKVLTLIFLLQIRKAYAFVYDLIRKKNQEQYFHSKFSEFDIINIHFLRPDFLKQIDFTSSKHRIFLSFWGSDLFQLSGVENYSKQLNAFNRADIISLHHPEMEQVFLSKFGKNLKHKVRKTIFGLPKKRVDVLRKNISSKLLQDNFRKKFGIPSNKVIIQVGYSGGTDHNHIQILENIKKIAKRLIDNIFIVIPTTYNNHEVEYYKKLIQYINTSKLPILHITEYMEFNEVLMLPVITNIHINLRNSDALNNSMMEALYAGNHTIVGSWMLYGVLRRKNIQLVEIEKMEELSHILSDCVLKFDNSRILTNSSIIEENFLMNSNITKWCSIYRELDTIAQ